MEQFVGLDVSQEVTHLCIIDTEGKTVWQGKSKHIVSLMDQENILC